MIFRGVEPNKILETVYKGDVWDCVGVDIEKSGLFVSKYDGKKSF